MELDPNPKVLNLYSWLAVLTLVTLSLLRHTVEPTCSALAYYFLELG